MVSVAFNRHLQKFEHLVSKNRHILYSSAHQPWVWRIQSATPPLVNEHFQKPLIGWSSKGVGQHVRSEAGELVTTGAHFTFNYSVNFSV